MTSVEKASNPKEAFGSAKVPVGLAPDSAIVEMALAFLEGALKYGRYNWRIAGVRASTYNDAMERHRKRWWNGQDRDPITRVRELGSIMACCAILIDAETVGKLNDDRPPKADLSKLLDDCMANVAHLKELFKEHSPHQFTHLDDTAAVEDEAGQQGITPETLAELMAVPGIELRHQAPYTYPALPCCLYPWQHEEGCRCGVVYRAIADQRPEWEQEVIDKAVADVPPVLRVKQVR